MIDLFRRPDPESPHDWPYDQRYACNCVCGKLYNGPKRSPECWDCVSPVGKINWLGPVLDCATNIGKLADDG